MSDRPGDPEPKDAEPKDPEPKDPEPRSGDERILWLDPGFGASGDMMLGALIGLGAPAAEIRSRLESLDVSGWTLNIEPTQRCSLSAHRALVDADEQHHHRTWSSIDGLLDRSDLPPMVKAGARATFRRLGEVEAGIHNVSIDEVHFHEVGAVDAIVDIVGSWIALQLLEVSSVICGPVGIGHGSTTAAHGRLPIPAPATGDLLIGATVQPVDVQAETVTPTGAALLTTMADRWGQIPAGRLVATARGAGGRDPDGYPNVLTAILISSQATAEDQSRAQQAIVLTTNLDDVTPEIIANTMDRCLAEGADDAWATNIVMKKGRPAVELNAMCSPERADHIRALIYAETGTLGIRSRTVTKHVLDRRFEAITVHGQTIAMKVGPYGAKPEYEDLVSAGQALNLPIRQLALEAMNAFETASQDANSGAQLAKKATTSQTHRS